MGSAKHSIASVAALLLSVAILLMGNGLQGTLLPVRADLEAFSRIEIGILGTSYFFGFTLGCLAGPALIARAGHIRAYLALVSVGSGVALLHAMIVEPALWWFFRALTGFCFAGLFIIIESWLNERAENETRGTVFSIYTIMTLTVVSVGQMIFTLSDPKSFSLFAIASILVSLAAVPVAFTRSQSPEPIPLVTPHISRLYALSPVGFMGCVSYGLTIGAFWTLGPIFALAGGLSSTGIGLFMSATVIGGAAGQWPLGRLSDNVDRRVVIFGTCLLASLTGLALSYVSTSASFLTFALGFIFGGFAFPLYALSVAHANDLSAPKAFVQTSSGLLLVYSVSAAAGPALASIVQTLVAQQSLFMCTAAVHLLTACFVLVRMPYRAAVPEDEKVEFDEALIATRTLAPLEFIEPPHYTEMADAER